MAKKLSAKIGEYSKDGVTKGRYVNIGVVMQSNDGGEYMLLDPTVSLAGVMQQQNTLAHQKCEQIRDRIMVSIFEEQQNAQQYNQAPQQHQMPAPSAQPDEYTMTPKAEGYSRAQYLEMGWTDDQLISQGYMVQATAS